MERSAAVNWPPLDKVAVLVNGHNETDLSAYHEALRRLGLGESLVWPVAKVTGDDAPVSELQTFCVVLEEAQRQRWRNILLLELPGAFMQGKITFAELTPLFADLRPLLEASDARPLLARLPLSGWLCLINARHYGLLKNALHRALEHSVSLDIIWMLLEKKYGWRAASAIRIGAR